MLIKNSNKNIGTWKTVEKKNSTLNNKTNSTNYETVALKNRCNNEFIEVTEDKEINDNVTLDNNTQKKCGRYKY